MCVACAEFIKSKLTSREFVRALGETTREDPEHLREVESALRASSVSGDSDDKLREKIRKMSAK